MFMFYVLFFVNMFLTVTQIVDPNLYEDYESEANKIQSNLSKSLDQTLNHEFQCYTTILFELDELIDSISDKIILRIYENPMQYNQIFFEEYTKFTKFIDLSLTTILEKQKNKNYSLYDKFSNFIISILSKFMNTQRNINFAGYEKFLLQFKLKIDKFFSFLIELTGHNDLNIELIKAAKADFLSYHYPDEENNKKIKDSLDKLAKNFSNEIKNDRIIKIL